MVDLTPGDGKRKNPRARARSTRREAVPPGLSRSGKVQLCAAYIHECKNRLKHIQLWGNFALPQSRITSIILDVIPVSDQNTGR